ncbi:hypothetical protein SmJEL517_g02810 [Synchytrium microbalum]|uniref:DUF7886 domain-containing protein n=1 Tax=Synchytrium microbalum TaxID=1806994 RepID=A0A507BZ70_9FUNG|nr:uncharacterized protein SmJEL517_g02810 [Synchytrium microbalum]TPX34570.1 hypothetical protein SmJEL517_g02810 [Synchytrium microbalum]
MSTSPKREPSKLNLLLAEFVQLGCLRGFLYFETYLRGREELLLRVYNAGDSKSRVLSRASSTLDLARTAPREQLSARTRHLLLDFAAGQNPPASPCDRELERDSSKTAFLIACYAKYNRPFVWIRSNQKRLIKVREDQKLESDTPLKLNSTTAWATEDVKLYDLVTEVLSLILIPSPENPFAVDNAYWDTLPVEEAVMATGAMMDFLQRVYYRNPPYSTKVMDDLMILYRKHFEYVEAINRK